MESKDNVQQEQPTQGTGAKCKCQQELRKKESQQKNKIRSTIANSIVFIILIAGFYWLVREYFHIGDKDYTEAAQVEEFINPVNTRVAGYIKEIKFIEHQQVKKVIHYLFWMIVKYKLSWDRQKQLIRMLWHKEVPQVPQ